MDTLTLESTITLLLLGVAVALIHMMFQLGVSVLTLLNGHSLGLRKAHLRLLHLNVSYIVGTFITILLVTLGILSVVETLNISEQNLWITAAVVSAVIGCIVSLTYYRHGKGTILWLPRSAAHYLSTRAKKTKYGIEAAALGGMTVIAEIPFAIAPLLVISLLLKNESREYQIAAIAIYAFLVIIPLLVIAGMIGSGHKISTIQRWREANKTFLQYSAGIGLVIIALYLTVFHAVGAAS